MPKGKYATYVLPRLEEVKEWASQGATDEEIFSRLNISNGAFYKYLKEYPEFKITIIEGRQTVVKEIRQAMLKKALGFTYQEKKTIKRTDDNGTLKVAEVSIVEKFEKPSENAAALLLRLYDKDFRDRDATTMALREREVALKEMKVEAFDWCGGEELIMNKGDEEQ